LYKSLAGNNIASCSTTKGTPSSYNRGNCDHEIPNAALCTSGLQWLLPSGTRNQRDVLTPQLVPQVGHVFLVVAKRSAHGVPVRKFAGSHTKISWRQVAAGPSSSVVIDRQGIYYVAGKVRICFSLCRRVLTSPDSSGKTRVMVSHTFGCIARQSLTTVRKAPGDKPYSNFRLLQEIMGADEARVQWRSDGISHWRRTEEEGDIMTIAWGQNAAKRRARSRSRRTQESDQTNAQPTPRRNQRIRVRRLPPPSVRSFVDGCGADVWRAVSWRDKTRRSSSSLRTRNTRTCNDIPPELDTPEECLICHQDNGDPLACDKVRAVSLLFTS